MEYKLYCDLDGVLANFFDGYRKISEDGVGYKEYAYTHGVEGAWDQIKKYGVYKYWCGLDWMPVGRGLWHVIKHLKPTILTSPSRMYEQVVEGKRHWCRYHLGYDVKMICTKNKAQYANEKSILIDDCYDFVNDWKKAGGKAIHVYDYKSYSNIMHEYGILIGEDNE